MMIARRNSKHGFPRFISAIADAVRWAEQIMEEIDRRHPMKPRQQQQLDGLNHRQRSTDETPAPSEGKEEPQRITPTERLRLMANRHRSDRCNEVRRSP
jgi:hypothetical protein